MLPNPLNLLTRIAVLVIIVAVIREMSIRRNAPAMTDWPRQPDSATEGGQ